MQDTETLIALVSSLLSSDELFSQDEILDALTQSDGDVDKSLQLLRSANSESAAESSRKRKRVGIQHWLKSPSKKKREIKPSNLGESIVKTSDLRTEMPPSSSSKLEAPVDLMTLLKQPQSPQSGPPKLPKLPPMSLPTPDLVAKHTPCTLHFSVLPPELACRLFHVMLDKSKNWKRNKWWLFDRVVESPHLTSFFARATDGLDDDQTWQEAAQYWYNGRPTGAPDRFPPEMEEACRLVENIVNGEMKKRPRFKLEWGGKKDGDPMWRANVAASNCYQGSKESVGFHTDQLTYLGPYPTIASLSLGTRRNFSLREVIPNDQVGTRKARTFNVPLPHNSLFIMHAGCQEQYKHSIPPQNTVDLFRPQFPSTPGESSEPLSCRINITFRFYRPDFRPPSIPRCHCKVPMILRPDMKNRTDGVETDKYWWTCYAGAQNDGKGCKVWKVMDMKEEGRGPCIGG